MVSPQGQPELPKTVGDKEQRKLKARRERHHGIWYGLGMFGLVGWSIAIPTLLGIAVGVWLDRRWPQQFSFTLMCLFLGVVFGCRIAWYWVREESREMDAPRASPDQNVNDDQKGNQP